MSQQFLFITNRIALPVEPPSRILICPWGNVQSTSGDFVLDKEGAESVIAAFTARNLELPIDYEHQTLGGEYASPDGTAPAAGWIKSLTAVEGEGLYANVEWTTKGADRIRNKEYRYLSPVTIVRKADRKFLALHSVGLTNTPAITGMKPVVNKSIVNDGEVIVANDEKLTQARWFLNLPTTATEIEIMEELEKFLVQLRELVGAGAKADQDAVMTALKAKLAPAGHAAVVCKALGIKPDADEAAVTTAVNSLRGTGSDASDLRVKLDAEKETTKALTARLEKVEGVLTANKADTRIAAAKADGKIVESMLEKGENAPIKLLANKMNDDEWKAYIESQPVVGHKDGRAVPPSTTPGTTGASNDRVAVINKAKSEWEGDRDIQKMTPDKTVWIANRLFEAKHDRKLNEKEKELIG